MSDFDAAKKRLEEKHHEWNDQGNSSGTCECGDAWPCPQLADIRLLLAEVERLKAELAGSKESLRGHVEGVRICLERAEKAEAEVERLREELTGQRAIERSRMRRFALSLQANIACPCGQVLQAVEQLEGHLDHMCNDESWRKAAVRRGEGEK